jgi:mannose-1-phosphate guanylyltransferase/mannose-6-phosphate isomerase
VILAGGAGTRLWPMSTVARPKHLLPLIGATSLFEQTLARFEDRTRFGPPIIVANQAQAAELGSLLAPVEGAVLILEPMKRDSAPAIALAALTAEPDELLLISPSDHHISEVSAFHSAIEAAGDAAHAGDVITFGIEPDYPATGFGYIAAVAGSGPRRVECFIEKPDAEHARALIAAEAIIGTPGFSSRALPSGSRCSSAMFLTSSRRRDGRSTRPTARASPVRPGSEEFARSPAQSIDYAVMEKERGISVVPVSMGWSDIGSWQSLLDAADCDERGNSVGTGHVAIDSSDTLIRSSGPRVAAIGVEGLVIIATSEAVLVVPARRDTARSRGRGMA